MPHHPAQPGPGLACTPAALTSLAEAGGTGRRQQRAQASAHPRPGRWARWAGLSAVAWGLTMAATAQVTGVQYFWSTPEVISPTGPAELRYEVQVVGKPTRAVFEFDPGDRGQFTDIEMNDEGRGGDRVAGDGIYTAVLPTAPLLAAVRPENAHRVFMGYVNLYQGTRSVYRGFHIGLVQAAPTADWPVTRRSASVQHTSHVVNVVAPDYFGELLPHRATQRFYAAFGDDYDFLHIVYWPSRHENRTYSTVRMAIAGLGRSPRDNTALYGSRGRLLGMVQFPLAPLFDGANETVAHELGHHWINGLDFDPLAQGLPHWPYSTMGTGLMGISIGGRNGAGGSFSCDIAEQDGRLLLRRSSGPVLFNDLDLYLMGLMPADEVAPQWVLNDQAAAASLQCAGQAVPTGAATRLTVQDVIARAGPRVPDAASAPRRFRVATLLVTRDGLASPEAMAHFSAMAQRAEAREPLSGLEGRALTPGVPFYVATRGRATLHTGLLQDAAWVARAAAAGPLSARRLTATLEPAAPDVGAQRQVFVAAQSGAQWFFLTPTGWQAQVGADLPAYANRSLPARLDVPVLDGRLDLSVLGGARVYMGYGSSAAEMLAAGRYSLVHVLH